MQSARGFEYGVRHIISPQSGTLFDVLLGILDLDREQIEFLLNLGSIYLNHERLHHPALVQTGDYIRVHTKPRRFHVAVADWSQRLVFENENFIVAQKPSGLPVHASVDNMKEHLQARLESHLGCRLYGTHRLDVPTKGLIVYAKNTEYQRSFNKLLIAREVRKIYRAQVEGHCQLTGILKHYMEPSPRAPKTVSREEKPQWQECILEILEGQTISPQLSELRILLHTGRTHQIRAQLSYEGFPILGDHAYGAKKIWDEEKIELEACELQFTDPLTGISYHFKI